MKVDYESVKEQFKFMITNDDDITEPKAESFLAKIILKDENKDSSLVNSTKKATKKSKTPVLDNFGRDLTAMAEQGKLRSCCGREKEIQRVSQILSRSKKNNPLLIGEPGVGKSAIAEGLGYSNYKTKSVSNFI